MARRRAYSIEVQTPVASATKTALTVTGSTAIRPWFYDMEIGSSASPADNALTWYIQRSTAAGTSTAYTPPPVDPNDPPCTSTGGVAHSAEPTYTANKILFHAALNQRATHRFQFDPDGPLMIPATSNNGLGVYPVHASFTGNADTCVWFAE
jgi:hypothetical protein